MATITIKHALDMVQDHIQDEDEDSWDIQDLINWYNIGTRTIVGLDSRANSVIAAVKLVAGIKQVIPSGGISFLNVIRNMGDDGETPGKTVYLTALSSLATYYPSYSTETATEAIFNAMPDPNDETVWHAYPPSDGNGYIELEYSKVPTIIVYDAGGDWESALVGIKENYIDVLLNYILHRGYGKDTDIPGNEDRTKKYYALFAQSMGIGAPAQGGQ